MVAPWRLAQFVYVFDSARYKPTDVPTSAPALLAFARQHPGRVTHPTVRNFLGATFLKQALYDLLPDPSVLQQPATDTSFGPVTAPLWAWYDQLRPTLWRSGREFPETGPAERAILSASKASNWKRRCGPKGITAPACSSGTPNSRTRGPAGCTESGFSAMSLD